VVAVDVAHHVTQRGNARQFILTSDAERTVYLELLRHAVKLHCLSVIGYCLMSNHIHLVVIPRKPEAMAAALKLAHGRYAMYWNAARASSGHVWQGRFYSCPLDLQHLWEALRYAELNPVRAGLTAQPELWRWSSAAAHCGVAEVDQLLETEMWQQYWTVATWREFLKAGESESALAAIRRCTHTGRPLGTSDFVKMLEKTTERRLRAGKGGRPEKRNTDQRQKTFEFGS